jgi:putative NADH-flavin reductase
MNILVVGANGRTGTYLVRYALDKGWKVTAYLRNKDKLIAWHESLLTVVEGDAYDYEKIAAATKGKDVVISALGVVDVDGDVSLMSEGAKRMVAGMQQHGVRRIIAIGGMGTLNADESGTLLKDTPDYPAAYKNVAEGHFKAWEVLQQSGMSYTFVCCPWIPDAPRTGIYETKKDYMPFGKNHINTGDLADFILSEAEHNQFPNCRVGITN